MTEKELFLKTLEKNQKEVDEFYYKALLSLKKKNQDNKDLEEKMAHDEQKIKDEIEEIENRIQKIKDDPSNYINKDKQNRFKDFSIEKKNL